jgi:hypothetical protein
MGVEIVFPRDLYAALITHLGESPSEQVAFLYTEAPEREEPLKVKELYRVPESDFDVHSAYHVTLSDGVRGQVIRRAWELGGCLVEVHSHRAGTPASFSRTDIIGLSEWVPHVRWRLRGRTYVALVFEDETFDALVWEEGNEEPAALEGLRISDGRTLLPTGLTLRHLSEELT